MTNVEIEIAVTVREARSLWSMGGWENIATRKVSIKTLRDDLLIIPFEAICASLAQDALREYDSNAAQGEDV